MTLYNKKALFKMKASRRVYNILHKAADDISVGNNSNIYDLVSKLEGLAVEADMILTKIDDISKVATGELVYIDSILKSTTKECIRKMNTLDKK